LAELLADFRRQTGVDRLSLSGIDRAAVASFVEQVAGHGLEAEDEAFAQAIYAETEGNPFFVGEVLRHLAETGAVERRHGRWATTTAIEELGIPEGIRDVVGRRLSRLSDEANGVLAVAAVIGADFELAVLQQAGGLPEDTVTAALDDAVGARLVGEVSGALTRYRFAHALVRATLYEELTAARRVALHRKVAEAIEAVHPVLLDDHLPALAYHYAQAAVPAAEPAKAVDYARRAGDAALAQLAHDDAVRYYRQALDLLHFSEAPVDDLRRTELLIALGEAQRRAGDPAHRETLLQAAHLAEEQGDGDALARAALANSRGAWSITGGVDRERVAALRAAVGAAGEDAVGTRAHLLANLAAETTFVDDEDTCRRLLDEALALARRAGEPATLASVLRVRYRSLSGPQAIMQRAAESSELLVLTESLGDPVALCWALLLRGRSALESGERDDADRCFERATQLVRETGQPTLRWFDVFYRTGLAVASGWADEAEGLGKILLDLGTVIGMPETTASYGVMLALQRFGDGDPAEAEPFLRRGVADLPGLEFTPAFLGWLAADTGRLDEAGMALATAKTHGFARPPRNHFYLATLVCWSAVAARMGDARSARAQAELLRPFPEHIVAPANFVFGSLAHTRGLLAATTGDFDEAVAHFAVAEAQHERLRFPTWLCRTRLEWARTLLGRRQSDDAERARELLGQALATAREFRLARVERDVIALLE
jgi:tetratricopeptide (TPR) repeat protein